jgi:hypothetical protein
MPDQYEPVHKSGVGRRLSKFSRIIEPRTRFKTEQFERPVRNREQARCFDFQKIPSPKGAEVAVDGMGRGNQNRCRRQASHRDFSGGNGEAVQQTCSTRLVISLRERVHSKGRDITGHIAWSPITIMASISIGVSPRGKHCSDA